MRNEHREIDIESLMSAVESLSNEEKILLEAKEIEREFQKRERNNTKGVSQKNRINATGYFYNRTVWKKTNFNKLNQVFNRIRFRYK